MSNRIYGKPPCRVIDPDRDALRFVAIGLSIALIALWLSGCSSQPERTILPSVEVEIPVAQKCLTAEQVPVKPVYEPIAGDYVQRQAAILTNRERKKEYLAQLNAALTACVGSK